MSSSREHINHNPALHKYYNSLESVIGYKLILNECRHFGYYNAGTYWPFRIDRALRAMEDRLFRSLALEPGAQVLDAGCGGGHAAVRLAQHGLRVQGIDVVDRHLYIAERNVRMRGLEDAVTIHKMDYHYLDFEDSSFDGVYTSESLCHATDPCRALNELFRVLKPGGAITLYEYDLDDPNVAPSEGRFILYHVNKGTASPSHFGRGVLLHLLEEAGLQDITTKDLSANIKPMLRLFFVMAILPYLFVRLFGLEQWFVNTVAGTGGYIANRAGFWRYLEITARKPSSKSDMSDKKVQRVVMEK